MEKKAVAERMKIAEDPNTTLKVLKELAKDPDQQVRKRVAKNPNVSEELLLILADDAYGIVRFTELKNAKFTEEIYWKLRKFQMDCFSKWQEPIRTEFRPIGKRHSL